MKRRLLRTAQVIVVVLYAKLAIQQALRVHGVEKYTCSSKPAITLMHGPPPPIDPDDPNNGSTCTTCPWWQCLLWVCSGG